VELVFKCIGNVRFNSSAAHAENCLLTCDLSAAKYEAPEAYSGVLQQRFLSDFIAAV
jgi:hypothetical protein